MQYLIIPLLIILAIGMTASRIDLPGFEFPNVLSTLGWGAQAPSSQGPGGTYLQQQATQPTNPLLDTLITEGPAHNSVFLTDTTATFKFSGTGPAGTVSNLTFETRVEGFDQSWIPTEGKSRTVTLPGGVKTYRFFVRSKLANVVDPTPASRIFKIQVSPYFGKVWIGSANAPSARQYGIVYLSSKLAQGEQASITGWKLQGKSESFSIPQGVRIYRASISNVLKNITLTSGTRAAIIEAANPLVSGMAFQPNRCMGYFTNTRTFPLSVPSDCLDFRAAKERSAISYLSPACQDYITNLQSCRKPDYRTVSTVTSNPECKDYLDNHFTYDVCVRDFENTQYFLSNEWHIYTESERFLRPGHDQILLYDSNNLFVASYDY